MANSTHDIESPPQTPRDWRVELFGSTIQEDGEQNNESGLVPTELALDEHTFDYIGVFFGADYCTYCKKFAPKLVEACADSLQDKKVKVIFASNDRDVQAFDTSCSKLKGIDAVPYDLSRTRHMRDIWGLKTIPSLVILRNTNFDVPTPPVVTLKARDRLESDMKGIGFPWEEEKEVYPTNINKEKESHVISGWDRFLVGGKYGKWYSFGHKVNPEKPHEMYMDEHAVRIRAGILNILSWLALINLFVWKDPTIALAVFFPLAVWEFVASIAFGLTPLAPIGAVAAALAMVFHPAPLWKPATPKRFAWTVGFTLATGCFTFVLVGKDAMGYAYIPLVALVILTCNVFTWLEASCGFCFGCFVYNRYVVPIMNLEECTECKI